MFADLGHFNALSIRVSMQFDFQYIYVHLVHCMPCLNFLLYGAACLCFCCLPLLGLTIHGAGCFSIKEYYFHHV